MKPCLSALLAGVAAALFTSAAAGQAAGPNPAVAPGAQPMDCATAKDKARCESLNKDIETCKDKTGDEWRECMHRPAPAAKYTPPKLRDCAKAQNMERCEAHNTALETCKDKSTKVEHRKCMSAQSPAPG